MTFHAATEAATPTNKGETTAPMEAKWFETSDAQWIWPGASGDGPNQYVQFLQDVELTGTASQIAISADTNYAVWLNGSFVNFGQWRNHPNDKTYDVLDLSSHAKSGKNRLAIVGYYQGENSSTYSKGAPGLAFAVCVDDKVVASSGASTYMRPAPDYVSGPVPKVTGQLGYTFEHYGNRGDNWLADSYEITDAWTASIAADMKPLASRPVRPRPIAKLRLEDRLPMRITAQGVFERKDPKANPADAVYTDALMVRDLPEIWDHAQSRLTAEAATSMSLKADALKDASGAYLVLDTDSEIAGLLDLELEAPEGTTIDIGYGEHLEDLRVRSRVGGRHFGVRHVTPAGHHNFLHPFLRLAGRYLQVHIIPPADAQNQTVYLKYAGLRPTEYPVERLGKFESSDSLHNKIWEVSRRTLELCMHEHYEDCPWREQALYAMDARNQALAGYYTFGNYDFAKASIGLLGQAMNKEDGFLELCAPAKVGVNIPSFSLAWILMLDDYMLFSGDREFAKSQLPVARQIFETCTKQTSGGLIGTPQGPRMWNFYEWAPGLDGGHVGGDKVKDEDRFEAPLNLFYVLALDAAARIAKETDEDPAPFEKAAAELRAAFADTFWDANAKAMVTRVGTDAPPHYAELTQALAIIADVVPGAELPALRERLASDNNGFVPCTISHTLYKFEALLTDKDRYAKRVFDLIERDWGYMLSQGATSFWETIDGASAFSDAGSLCHGWSGVLAWFYGAYVLGVKPITPGFENYETKPVTGVFPETKGTVPTPKGLITIP